MTPKQFNLHEEEIYYQLFVQGDESGLKYFYDLMNESLFVYTYDATGNEFESDSIIQDIFLLVWLRREKMESASHIKEVIRQGIEWRCNAYQESKETAVSTSPLTDYENIIPAADAESPSIDSTPKPENGIFEAWRRNDSNSPEPDLG